MILAQGNNVETQGIGETRGLTIRATGQAFRFLSSDLYSNKIRAVLRETGCNARDSHVEAGNADVPFEVKLPNVLDPSFYVRDFGTGLDEADIFNLYLTYFSSSKQQSNEYVGGFGVGSKSPFAYTDAFTVIAAKDGIQRTFGVFIGEDYVPQVVKVAEQPAPANWQHGIQVGFAVKPGDFAQFSVEAHSVFQWFAVRPIIKGAEVTWQDSVPVLSSPFAEVYDRAMHESGHCAMLVMGGVPYSAAAFWEKNKESGAGCERLVLHAPIGSVQVSGSREQIALDPATEKTMELLFTQALTSLAGVALEPLTDASLTGWEQFAVTVGRLNALPMLPEDQATSVLTQIRATKGAAAVELCRTLEEGNWVYNQGHEISHFLIPRFNPALVSLTYQRIDGLKSKRPRMETMAVGSGKELYTPDLPRLMFIHADSPSYEVQRVRKHLLQTGQPALVLKCVQKGGAARAELTRVLAKFGDPRSINASDLEFVLRPSLPKGAPRLPTMVVEALDSGAYSSHFKVAVTPGVSFPYLLRKGTTLSTAEGECLADLKSDRVSLVRGLLVLQLKAGLQGPILLLNKTEVGNLTKVGIPLQDAGVLVRKLYKESPMLITRDYYGSGAQEVAGALMGETVRALVLAHAPNTTLGKMAARIQYLTATEAAADNKLADVTQAFKLKPEDMHKDTVCMADMVKQVASSYPLLTRLQFGSLAHQRIPVFEDFINYLKMKG